ncbi:A-kinase anchor protein 12 isoform X2 [Paroedura picta]|uniref:A-kinase anchor protein 12 isoform X2 n=1 Tax=Paroedura picta TaxID=143630 RepID=UPI0040577879
MLGTITITVGERETPNVILKEESAEHLETKTPESDKTNVDDKPKASPDVDKQLPTPEEQELPCESPSNDVGFKKVFKFVGFKFTVRKDKTEKSEPVQLLNVKADDAEVAAGGAGDCEEVKTKMEDEAIQSEESHSVEKTEQQTQTEQVKEDASSEQVKGSPVEPTEGSKEAEIKSDSSKLVESPTSPSANETASPLRKFFTQGWAGLRKKTSFRKPKDDVSQPVERQKQGKEKEMAEENAIKEELEKEKAEPEKDEVEIFVEHTDEIVKREREETEEVNMRNLSTETHQEEPLTLPSQESVKIVNKESEICLTEKIGLAFKEKSEPMQECLSPTEQSALPLSEKKHAAPLAKETLEEKLDKCAPISPFTVEKTEEHFEILEDKPEPKAPLATESFDEITTEFNNDVTTTVKKEQVKTNKKIIHEQFVETDAELTHEELKITEIILVAMNEQIKKTEPSSGAVATCQPPEGITNEVELLSSQERAKIQGSPLKKLFTSSSLKKLSGKKNTVKREEAKSGEQTQQLSDSAESPEELKGESSDSSPEETIELSSVQKVIGAVHVPETEESSASDMEKKREGVTPWASFKKMVTPKKSITRVSENCKEEELEKSKNIMLSSTESAPCEEQEDDKENGEEQKLEKSTDEPKRKVDTSVSWEALICVGSSKKRARKSSSSDEEVGQRLAQEGQKPDESGTHKETTQERTLTSSQESGEGNSSPEQVGSPSESEGVSTWESFKRLVTPRRKSKTRMEDKAEEPVTVPSSEHSVSDGDSGKEESWVSFKKLMPGRRKKKSDGIPEHTPVEEVGDEIKENNEEDYDVPAVVPLSEYEAAEQEKFEAQKAKEDEVTKKRTLDERTEESKDTVVDEVLVHAVTVTVVEGERAVTSIEERSPSWIPTSVTEPIEYADEDKVKQIEQISEMAMEEEIAEVTKHMPEIRKDISGDTIISELELTPEAITAREEASGVEEVTEVSCAEETTEMVSAVSRLSESPDTTAVATPVQEVKGQQNLEELNKQTQEVLKEAAERVRLSDETQLKSEKMSEIAIQEGKSKQEITVMFPEVKLADSPLKVEDPERVSMQTNEGTEDDHSEGEVIGSGLKEVLKKNKDSCAEEKERPKESINLDRTDESETEQRHEEISKEQTTEEKSEEEDFGFVIVTAGEEPDVNVDETIGKQQDTSLEAVVEKKYGTIDTVLEVTVKLEEKAQGEVTEECVTEVDEWMKRNDEEKTKFSQNLMQIVVPGLESENAERSTAEVKKALVQSDVKDTEQFIQSADTGELMPEVPNQSLATEVPMGIVENEMNTLDFKDVTIGLEIKSTEKVATGTYLQNKDTEAFLHNVEPKILVPKMEPDIHLQNVEMEIPVENVKQKPHLLNTETQIYVDTIETGISIRKRNVEVHQLNSESKALTQKVETESYKEVEKEPCLLNVEAEVSAKTSDVMVEMTFSPDTAKAEIPTDKATVLTETEAEVSVEKTGGKVHMESSSEKSDAEVMAPAEKIDVKVDVVSSVAKVVENNSAENEVVEFHAEEVVAEVGKVADMKVPAEMINVKNLTEDAKVEPPRKTIEVLTEEAKADIPSEMVNTRTFTENINMEAPAKQLEELVKEKAVSKPSDQEENLQNFKAVVCFQSEMEDTVNSVEVPVCADLQQAPVVDDICRVPVHRMMQDVTSSFQVEYLDSVGSEGPFKVKDPGLSPKTNELGDVNLILESKCAEDIGTETPVQKRKNIPFMETEGKSKNMDTAASEVLMQSQKENVLALKSNFVEAELTENVVNNEATFVENELGNTALAINSKHIEAAASEVAATTEVEEDTLFLDSRFAERIPESCPKGQVLSEKVVTVGNDKSAENTELTASEHVLYAAPMQQHPKHQEVVATDIPEMQSHGAYKSSVSVTAAAVEEQVIEESVIATETSTETIQSFLEEPKETAFKIVQPVTIAHSELGARGPYTEAMLWAEKTESATEKPILPVDDLIQTHVFDLIPKMKSELSQETEKQIQTPESSPSLTHVDIQKDDVQLPGTIESQSTNIVLKIIRNAVEETEEAVSVSDQVCENKSEIQESLQADQHLLSVKVEKKKFLRTEEKVSLSCGTSEDQQLPLGAVAKPAQDHGTVNEGGQEVTEEPGLQKENSETEVGSEVDPVVPTEAERVLVDDFVSGELPKESLDIDQSKLKSVEAGHSVQMQEHFIEQQTYTKRKEDQSTGLGESHMDEDVNNQDYTVYDLNQSSLNAVV